jgi:hypothetical protein
MWFDENEVYENGCPDYYLQSVSSIDDDFSELRDLFSEQQELSISIIDFLFDNIDGNHIFMPKNDVIQNNPEQKKKEKIVEAILISSKKEDKEKISTKEDEKKGPFQLSKKKRRKIAYKGTSYEYEYDSNQYLHCSSSNDNIAKKIESHYLNFLILFLNVILKKLNCKQKFCGFNKQSKIFSNASKANIKEINNKTIKEILFLEITKKQKKIYEEDKYKNKSVYKEVLMNFPQMNDLFEKKVIDIFNEIYYDEKHRNLKLIDLNKYNINLIIDLKKEKLENFEDLLTKKKEESAKKEKVVKSDYFKYK